MTHEFRNLIRNAVLWQNQNIKMVLATVVALNGSSYRRPGVRMLLNNQGQWIGAVSGGCVEKEVYRQALHVFETGQARLMSYDGTYRLGCEGTLYVLLEAFEVTTELVSQLEETLNGRGTFDIKSYYDLESSDTDSKFQMGSVITLGGKSFGFQPKADPNSLNAPDTFIQDFLPIFQLYIFGAEHDAVALSKTAFGLGWDVHIYASPDEQKSLAYFEGAVSLQTDAFDAIDTSQIDENSAVMLMTHSFNKDVQYLMALKDTQAAYFGLLGPAHRRERLLAKFLEFYPETEVDFFEKMHGPAGINIGAESASEIAISIVSEILAVLRNQKPQPLKDKPGTIHA